MGLHQRRGAWHPSTLLHNYLDTRLSAAVDVAAAFDEVGPAGRFKLHRFCPLHCIVVIHHFCLNKLSQRLIQRHHAKDASRLGRPVPPDALIPPRSGS